MLISDVTGWVSASAAAGGFLAAAYQLRRLRVDRLDARTAEIQGVALETTVVERPVGANAGNGRSRWVYDFAVHNPGALPISAVEVLITFPVNVEREHYDGSLDPGGTQLEMNLPVVAAGGHKQWRRTVLVEHVDRGRLRETRSEVVFNTPDAGRIRTVWPQEPSVEAEQNALRRRLAGYRA